MSAQAPTALEPDAAPLLDTAGVIQADLQCRRCGYNLRGLHHEGRCPECGIAIGLSCHGDLLRFADPQWLEKLARGAKLIIWGVIIAWIFGMIVGVLSAVAGLSPLVQLVGVLGGLVTWYGLWLMTEPDPSGVGEDRYANTRRVLRIGMLVLVGLQVGNVLITQMNALMVVAALGFVSSLTSLIVEMVKLTYFRRLALRIPDQGLARRAARLRTAFIVVLVIMIVTGAGAAAVGTVTGGAGAVPTPAGVTVVGGPPPSAPAAAPGADARYFEVTVLSAGETQNTDETLSGVATAPAAGPTTAPVAMPMAPPLGGLGAFAGVACLIALLALALFVISILILVLTWRLGKAIRAQAEFARATWAAARPPGEAGPAGAASPTGGVF